MRIGRLGHVLRMITCALSVTGRPSLTAQQPENPSNLLAVNPEWINAFAAEAYGMNRFGPEILERGRYLYQNGISTQNCQETVIGAALIAHAWISIGTGDALAELDKLDITRVGPVSLMLPIKSELPTSNSGNTVEQFLFFRKRDATTAGKFLHLRPSAPVRRDSGTSMLPRRRMRSLSNRQRRISVHF